MTIIAWDGHTLAADKQSTANGFRRVVTKVHMVPDGIIGCSGSATACVAMRDWFMNGRQKQDWPQIQSTDKDAYTMFVDWAGRLWIYEDFPHPIALENRYDAMGSGRDFALAALELGHDAVTAVQVASKLCNSCGMGYDALNLEECRKKRAQL